MKSTKIILDSHLTRRDEALGFVQTGILAAESPTFAGFAVIVDAGECDVMDYEFGFELMHLLLEKMKADSVDIVNGPEHIVHSFKYAAAVQGLDGRLRINGTPVTIQTHRTMPTEELAGIIGNKVADQRATRGIGSVVAGELARWNTDGSRDERAVMANKVSKLIMADPVYDNETAMAVRAVTTVLTEHFGDTVGVNGLWTENETVIVRGGRHLLTGRPCSGCRVYPECLDRRSGTTYCTECSHTGVQQPAS